MKQPELGKKISELRKAKGLTQEELVDLCNVSVRTIQRIETGEVTPRSFTVKSILAALGYDYDEISGEKGNEQESSFDDSGERILGFDILPKNKVLHLYIALACGAIYFFLGFLEGAADYYRYDDHHLILGLPGYIAIKLLVLVSFIFFQRGFIIVAEILNNSLLKLASSLLILGNALIIAFNIITLINGIMEPEALLFGASLLLGALGIFYGFAILRLQDSLGKAAQYAGIFELVTAAFFLTIIFSFLALLLQIPAELMGLVVLYKALKYVKLGNGQQAVPRPGGAS